VRPIPVSLPLWLLACADSAEGLRVTPDGAGPVVVVDWEREPAAELPFPNDLSTTPDPTSPTGLRLNFPTLEPTEYESEVRTNAGELTGFGVYSPITASFSARLDIDNIKVRHPDDYHRETWWDDDAFLLIDVDPESPEYGRVIPLDVGHGRYPADPIRLDRYFPNDSRLGQPSLIWETVDEDLNDNGVIDPGEDTDGDGRLDFPNVWPTGGDPFTDLLTFYDLQVDKLFVRPVRPLREETTYAVVLTDRLVDEQGLPVRSPWEFVHHTRQTAALRPLEDLLPDYGLTVDNVAFAWTFSTARVTGDMRDLRAGLFDGTGPYGFLRDAYPAGFTEALAVQDDEDDAWTIATDSVIQLFAPLGLVGDGEGLDLLLELFGAFSGDLVGGTFTAPYLLIDTDEGGRYDADERWRLNPTTGEIVHAPARVPFTCFIPSPHDGFEPPYDVAIYGHGYGSNRLEGVAFSAHLNQMGIALCAPDAPGHGVSTDPETIDLARGLLGAVGASSVIDHILDGRARDLDNDGEAQSGGDQWSADAFHTRDMVRQSVLEWMQLVRSLRACGAGEMTLSLYEDGTPAPSKEARTSCDWNGDGTPDIGGPDAKFYVLGGSLGGITASVAAGSLPDIEAFVPVVPGGGLVDVGTRTEIGGAVEAFVGRFLGPLFLGYPDGDGVRVTQMVNSVTRMVELPIGHFPARPEGGSVRVTNLATGESHTVPLSAGGTFRAAVATDALDPGEKAIEAGIPVTGPEEGVVYTLEDNVGLGDPLIVELMDATGAVIATLDSWETDVLHEGVTMRAGSPLVAGTFGNGKLRGDDDARRGAFLAGMILEPGDPIAYAPHWFDDPFPELGAQNVLLMPTTGDPLVPVATGLALARASGMITPDIDPRYGTSVDRWLIDRRVIQGVEERGPWRNELNQPVLFDIDNVDEFLDGTGAPSDAPLRLVVDTESGKSALRLPYISPQGTHGFSVPTPERAFDTTNFTLYQISRFLSSGGTILDDRLCLEDGSCPELPVVPE
jgi:hypothetical protein